MEFSSIEGPCVLVDGGSGDQRLQAFACRAFREQLGRTDGQLHASCRLSAKYAAENGQLLVNSRPQRGRHVLQVGDIITLSSSGSIGAAIRNSSTGKSRMSYGLEEDPPAGDPPCCASSPSGAATTFADYYNSQRICDPSLWPAVVEAFCRPLPLSLRVNTAVPGHSFSIGEIRAAYGSRLQRIPWAPGGWRLTGQAVAGESKLQSDELANLLQQAQCCGSLALQESAAMLPALALRPRSDHHVLDLCAAPGGKTLQLLDSMLCSGGPPSGILVSNDIERLRQERTLRRCRSMFCSPLVVTVGDAASWGMAYCDPEGEGAVMLFDRILCDVPCGGDGTLRKSPDKLHRWTVTTGLRNHSLQLSILRNGLRMLKPGGVLVYSTCCLDPLQNEAVVSAALSETCLGGTTQYTLLPSEEAFPEEVLQHLRFDPGVRQWRVPHPEFASNGLLYADWADVPTGLRNDPDDPCDNEESQQRRSSELLLTPSMFCTNSAGCDLRRCVRLLPNHDDCGGFFVSVIQRSQRQDCMGVEKKSSSRTAQATPSALPVDVAAPIFLPPEEDIRKHLTDFFGLRLPNGWELVVTDRGSAGEPLLFSLVPHMALRLRHQDQVSHASFPQTVQVIGAGVPCFCRMPYASAPWWPQSVPWRICQEAAEFLSKCGVMNRVLRCTKREVAQQLLRTRCMPLDSVRRAVNQDGATSLCLNDSLIYGGCVVSFPNMLDEEADLKWAPAVAAVLASSGLMLLADDDVLRCLSRRIGSLCEKRHP